MKTIFVLIFSFFLSSSFAQSSKHNITIPDSTKPIQVVEAACGGCKFGLKGKGCALAVRIDNKAYFVDGASIDEFGDAHAKDGMCVAIRKAEVQGKIVNNKYKVSYFKLLPGK